MKTLLKFTIPGPHLFVFVITVLRFTEDDRRCISLLADYFGKITEKLDESLNLIKLKLLKNKKEETFSNILFLFSQDLTILSLRIKISTIRYKSLLHLKSTFVCSMDIFYP